jgi:hypothetical protein
MRPHKFVIAIVAMVSAIAGALAVSMIRGSGEKHGSVATGTAPVPTEETFHMMAPDDAIATTHGGYMPLPLYPPGIGALSDDRINRGFILLTKLRAADGTVVGFTSEQKVVSSKSNFAQGLLMTASSWILTVPGRGTIFLYETENQSEFLKKAGLPALSMGREWNEPWTFVTTAGPAPKGRGIIVGGTDEFEGISGTFSEVTHLRRFTPKGELFGTIELKLVYVKPQGSAAAGAK